MSWIKEIEYKVASNGCMECTSHYTDRQGYPHITRNSRRWRMSRYIYTSQHGEIPDGLQIRHQCDNPKCINIKHLLIGTHQDNVDDKVDRNRQLMGVNVHTNKLTEAEVLEIRKIGRSVTIEKLADIFGCTDVNISCILLRKTWKHI